MPAATAAFAVPLECEGLISRRSDSTLAPALATVYDTCASTGNRSPHHVTSECPSRFHKVSAIVDTITGLAGASGVADGVARVISQVEDADQLSDGEILVTTVTNIGWTPIFPRAAAVVTDVGAPLSHAAIVARELGIPAVVGCRNATMQLHSGDRIRVDGGKGTVEVLYRA